MTAHSTTELPARPTIQQAAEYANVDPKTIRRWISQGRLKAFRYGSRVIRIDRDSLQKLARPIGGAL
jgi:excisionase family DNA binding protein